VLIDVPPTAKFAADIRGILLEGESRTVPWEAGPQASYLTAATVAAMEQSIRSILYLYDPEGGGSREELARLAREVG